MEMATVRTPMHQALTNALTPLKRSLLLEPVHMATMVVLTPTAMASPIQSMIVPAVESHGVIRSDARIPMVTVGPIHRVNLVGMVTIQCQIGCNPGIPMVTVVAITMGLTAVEQTATQMNSH
jgi:hypothetical protein